MFTCCLAAALAALTPPLTHTQGYPKPWELMSLKTGEARQVKDSLELAKRFGPQHKADFTQEDADEMMWAYHLWAGFGSELLPRPQPPLLVAPSAAPAVQVPSGG